MTLENDSLPTQNQSYIQQLTLKLLYFIFRGRLRIPSTYRYP